MKTKMYAKLSSVWNVFLQILITAYLVQVISGNPVPSPESDLPEEAHHHHQEKSRVRRQYYVCPPEFERITNNCYYFSQHMATWQDAHYECRDRDSELAMLNTANEDKKLRLHLNKNPKPVEWWIGGIYDWEQMKWKWGSSGMKLAYHGFSRMGPENKEKLKWHCIILDPTMRYKWSARSCVLGKYFICQKKVLRVGNRDLKKLRQKYNNTLNEIAAPIYIKPIKPRKTENLANGNTKKGLKSHRPNGVNSRPYNVKVANAYGHRRNNTELARNRKRERKSKQQQRKERKNRRNRNRNLELQYRNGTLTNELGILKDVRDRRYRKRNRRNKSKESNSIENSTQEEFNKTKILFGSNEMNSTMEDITQKTIYMANTISPLHPRVIIEEHDFLDLNTNQHN